MISSGFYSKDLIYEFSSVQVIGLFAYLIYYLSIGMIVRYFFRLINFVILGNFHNFLVNLLMNNFLLQ